MLMSTVKIFIVIFMCIFCHCHILNGLTGGDDKLSNQKQAEFAIYLPAILISPKQMSNLELSKVELNKSPIIWVEDIISYKKESHEIKVTESAYQRINKMNLSVYGTVFVVCVGKIPIYWGAFWTNISSIPFDGVVILLDMPTSEDKYVIQIQLGYPTSKYFSGEDPRADIRILRSLSIRNCSILYFINGTAISK